jgi:TP901 family phage tail tape measure protein
VTDIINGGLRGALNLAAAGNQTVGQAAETAATSMTRFGLSGAQVPHVADVLAAAANKAQGDVSDMASALDYAGVQAAQMGASFESVVGTLALFAHNGLVGSQAGTELRGMIASLSGPSKAAKNEMEGLGISIYDVHGKFIGLDGVANELHTKLSGLSQAERDQALNIIFSNQQMAAAEILMKSGAKGVQDWTNNVNQSGYAANLAGQKMNNLAGDVEQLKGSIETALIQSGSSGNTVLRGMAKGANDVVGAYLDMPGPVQKGATAVAAVGSAAAITGGAMLLMIPKIEAAKARHGGPRRRGRHHRGRPDGCRHSGNHRRRVVRRRGGRRPGVPQVGRGHTEGRPGGGADAAADRRFGERHQAADGRPGCAVVHVQGRAARDVQPVDR